LLQSLLSDGEALNIPLPELDLLETELKLAHWLDDINTMFDSGGPIEMDTVEDLLREASAISSHPGVNKAVVKLQDVLELANSWESKAQAALTVKPHVKASFLEALLEEASQFMTQLPAVSQVKSALGKANMWMQEAKRLQSQDRHPWLLELEGLLTRGRSIPVHLPDMAQIESILNAARGWRDQVSKLFLKRNSTWTCLLEVLLPRVSVELNVMALKRREWERIVGDGSVEVKDEMAQVVEGEATEWEEMRKLRERNQARRRCYELNLVKASDLQQRFCVCKRYASPNMVECQLCRDWFHNKCVLSSYCKGSSKVVESVKFLCGSCIRTRRPGMDMVNLMVLNLRKVPVLMPEALALERLAHRATEWQQRARQALALAQDSLTQTAKESELLIDNKEKENSSHLKSEVERRGDCIKDRKNGEPELDVETVSPLSAGEPAPPVNLRDDLRGELEELMFEGDLLEVTLDETQQIWQLLQSGYIQDNCVPSVLVGEERVDLLTTSPESARKRKSRCESESKRRRKRVRRPKIKKEQSSYEDEEEDNDEEEQCAAVLCLMPASEEVQWIQCDHCHEWYHFACVELTKETAQALDTYICTNCSCTMPV
jgi:histone demethylase JARID1